jgi:hypothetical protein
VSRPPGTAIALEHKDEIIERISKGEPLSSIASDLGYSGHSGITERLGQDPDYKLAIRSGVIGKIEKREQQLELAQDNVSVTRADRLLGHARWWAEKWDRERFGKDDGDKAQSIQIVIQNYTTER